MQDGRGEYEWQQTSSLLAQQINLNRKKNAKIVSPDELNPYSRKSRRKPKVKLNAKQSMDILKAVFCKQ